MLKKLGIVVGVIVGLFVLAAVVIPLVYDVNTKVRPLIVQAIEDNLNAKAEIGKLNLSLWGGINIAVESMKIQETVMNTTVFEMKNAKFAVPFGSLFGGKLSVTLVADAPQFNVVKDKSGQMNVVKMMKTKEEKAKVKEEKPATPSSGGGPDLTGRISISTKITNAKLMYSDAVTNSSSTIDKLGLDLSDIGIGTPIKMKVTADLAVTQGKDISLKGPIAFDGTAKVMMADKGFDKADFEASLNLDGLEVRYSTLFDKGPQVPLRIDTKLVATADSLVIEKLDLVANDFKINTVINVTNFDAPQFDVKLNSNQLKLENWRNIIAPLKQFDMAGGASLNFAVRGTAQKFDYNGKVDLAGASLQSPGVVPRVEDINAKLDISTDTVKLDSFSLKIASSDMSGSGVVRNFAAPNISLNLRSKVMNVDEIIGMKFDEKKEAAPAAPTVAAKEVSQEEQDKKMEAMAKGPVQAIKSNPVTRNLVFKSNTKIDKLVVHKATMTDFDADVDFDKLTLSMKQAKLKLFSGTADAKMSVDFNGADPAYKLAANMKGVDIDAAATSQFADLKGFITGKAQTTLDISGSGVSVGKAKQTLKGVGKFDILDGTWSGLTPLKMIGEKLKSIPQAAGKLDGAVVGNKFKSFTGQYTIASGKVNLSNVAIDMEEAKTGVTAAGWVDFDKKMSLAGNLIVPMSDAPKKLLGPDGRARIPFEVGGMMMSPTPNIDATLKPVASAYLEHEGKKVVGQAIKKGVEELKKNEKLKEVIKDEKVNDLLKGFGL